MDRGIESQARHGFAAVALLAIERVIRAWNQTGQKFAGDPDIVKIFLYPNPIFLWVLVGAAYIWIHRQLIAGFNRIPAPISYPAITGLVLAAATFKVAFTYEDAPELVVGFAKTVAELEFTQRHTLVSQARAVFLALGLSTVCALFYILMRRQLSLISPGA